MASKALTKTISHSHTHTSQNLSHTIAKPLSLITSITSLLQTQNLQNPNPSFLNQFSPYLNPNLVIQVIKNQRDPYHALFFFNWASNPDPNPNRYTHSHLCYVAITDVLISHRLFSTAQSLLESSNRLSDFIIGRFIKGCGDFGDIRGAIHWFNRAKVVEFGKCLFSYNTILGVLVKANQIGLAEAIFDQLVKEGLVKPDVFTYTTMIRGYCKMGMIENAKKVFDEMICRPNLVTYNTMINGFCKKGLLKNARGILDKMIESNDCLPDTVTFTTLIDGYCKNGELEEAKKCIDEMVNCKCEPNVVTYNAIIDGLCMRGNVDEAKIMMTKMRLNGVKDNVATHTSILKGLCIVGKSDEATRYLREMIGLGMNPDVKSYGVVVNEYCRMRKQNEAIMLLEEMRTRGINPSVSSFNAVFRILVESGELDRAIRLLKKMPKMGCSPNFISYSTVIFSLCKAKCRMEEVEELVNGMLRDGHGLDASMYSCLVNGYCEAENYEMAIRVSHETIDMGYMISLESFSLIVKKFCERGKAYELEKLFEKISSCPVIDADTYRRLLDEHLCKI